MGVTPRKPVPHEVAEALGRVEGIDAVADPLARRVSGALGNGALKDLLSGVPLGHPLHPLMTDLPIGTWTSAMLLDLLGGRPARPAADRLVGLGLLAAAPTVAAGLSDWADTIGAERRIGVAHAAANVVALTLYGGSWVARRRGRRGLGVTLALAGGGAMAAGGHLGGHLSYARAVGVDQTALEGRPGSWTATVAEAELAEGVLAHASVAGTDVLLVRRAGRVLALSDTCSHRGGALHEGTLEDGCVVCPLHGSRFRLEDGSVERGPATYPQPRWETRVTAGRVEVRAAGG